MRAVGVILALTLAMGSIAFSASPALAALPEASSDNFTFMPWGIICVLACVFGVLLA